MIAFPNNVLALTKDWASENESKDGCHDLGEIRHDLDTLLAADSVCLRTLSDLPQSGNL